MAELQLREALGQAMDEEMAKDDKIFIMGEEVAEYNGAYKVTKGLLDKYGPRRVWDSPISENGFAGLGIGAAMAGLRPVIEMMTWNFGLQAFDQIVNHAAKMHYMSAGEFTVPITFRGPNGFAHMLGAQHSQSYEAMITNVPGLKVVSVGTPYDAKGLLKSAILDNNPVIFLESEMLYSLKGEVPDEEYTIPLGQGVVRREGKDVTLIGWNKMTHVTQKAAELLEAEGIDAEVIDPLTLQPLDEELIFNSVRKTHRLVIVDESWDFASVSAQISDRVQRECFDDLDAPVVRVSTDFVHFPYAEHLEHAIVPTAEKVVEAVKVVTYQN
jgi:pyruvate dehydrogenase E1 component beta subunit